MKQIYIILALALSLCFVGSASAIGPWVPIVKSEQSITEQHKALDLQGSSSVAFAFIRNRVKANTDPAKVDLRPDYGAFGTRAELSTFPDDWLPIARSDYSWEDQSPIYHNPHMDYYYGYQMYDLEGDYGGSYYQSIPQKYDEWNGYESTKLSFDKAQVALDKWANAPEGSL